MPISLKKWWNDSRKSAFFQRRSILNRWLTNNLLIFITVFAVIGIGAVSALHSYYYFTVETSLADAAKHLETRLEDHAEMDQTNLDSYLAYLTTNYSDADTVELQLLYADGSVGLSSDTIQFDTSNIADFETALQSDDQVGKSVGKTSGGERYMAYSRLITQEGSSYCSFRLITSLRKVDRILLYYNLAIWFGILLVLLLIIWSNSFFIRSIVYPVQKISETAGSFASGNFSDRIEVQSQDEIGVLADSLNEMADKLEKTEKMQNDFISSVSHELRTPLTAIRGWSETLADPSMRDEQLLQTGMGVIIKETSRLSSMVEELLDFSRLQNGRLTVARTRMDLLEALDDAVTIYAERAKRDKKTLLVNEPEAVSFVIGDSDRLKQVFINIIDNALKYSDEGGVVMVDVKERDGYIIVRVSDTGCGIKAEDLPHIKEKFFKANMTRRGSGIGLAVADEIVRMHNGELLVESQEKVGTTMTIRIPNEMKEEQLKLEAKAKAEERGNSNAESGKTGTAQK